MNQIRVDNEIHLPKTALPPKQMEKLIQRLTVPNPEYITRKRMGKWLGGVPDSIECFRLSKDSIALPRGAVRLLQEMAIEAGASFRFADHRLSFPFVGYPIRISLRPYQSDAIGKMYVATQGVIVMPCGGGKSLTGVGVIVRLGQPTIILVHTLDLVEQWRDLLVGLGVRDIGIICDGVNRPETITLATVQTLSGRDPDDPLFRQFGCVIQDEGHHVPGLTFREVFNRFPAKHRFALTATPDRADGLTNLLFHYVGPILHEVDFGYLVENGYLIEPEIRIVETGFTADEDDSDDFNRICASLVRDKDRNRLIVDTVTQQVRAGNACLVLSARVGHCRTLARMLREKGVEPGLLVGEVEKDHRKRILTDVSEGRLNVVVSSTLFDEGLDVPRLSRLFLAFPTRAESKVQQRVGRIMRVADGKADAVVYDFVDANEPMLHRQFQQRRRLYARLFGPRSIKKLNPETTDHQGSEALHVF